MTTYTELKEKLKTGEDVSAYINTDMTNRIVLAKHGLHVEELIHYNETTVIKTLIKNGYAENHYDEWKTHKDKYIRVELAKRRYFPEHFIKDNEYEVRIAVARKFPEYVSEIIGRSKQEEIAAAAIFIAQDEPDMELLQQFVATNPQITTEQRIALSKYPSCIHNLLKSKDIQLIKNLIRRGLMRENYEDWKNHPYSEIRLELASTGYDPDYFIHDSNEDVKFAAFKHKTSLLPEILEVSESLNLKLIKYFSQQQSLRDIDLVKQFLNSKPYTIQPLRLTALKIKYQMQTTETSLITKTMSLRQQVENNYYAFSKHWSGDRIYNLLIARQNLGSELFLDNIDKLVPASTSSAKLDSIVYKIYWGN